MERQFEQTDVIIVGGGLAGLTAACYLARDGVAVTLFEKAAKLGGRAATQNYDGYLFNRGIHALYTGGAASEVLRELGIPYSSKSPKNLLAMREGKLYPYPAEPMTLLRSKLFDIADKLELIGFFAKLQRMEARAVAGVSIEEWLKGTFQRPRVRQFMTAVARTNVYSTALDMVSAEVNLKKLQIALKNPVYYIDGGWQTLVEGLRKAAEQAGARIVSGERVEGVEHEDGKVRGVRLSNGEQIRAGAVIMATAPKDAVKLVDGGNYEALRKIVEGLIPARVACLDAAVSRLPRPDQGVVQDVEQPRFLSTQSLYARIAPEGGALIHSFKQLDPREESDPREDERELEELLDRVQTGWREVVVKRVFLPHIEAIGMLPTARGGGYAGRPGPVVPGIENLYVVGDWVGEGFLADPSMGSAREVAQLLTRDGPLSIAGRVEASSGQ